MVSHLISKTALGERYHYHHFIDKETELRIRKDGVTEWVILEPKSDAGCGTLEALLLTAESTAGMVMWPPMLSLRPVSKGDTTR